MPSKSSKFRGVTLFRPTKKWRAQISAAGKTTSLGDHDTEEEAARAFDRAAINKAGAHAATNYPIEDYHAELEQLSKVSVTELVASLRAKARRHGTQTSQYRGVSLLKQTGKWHGQINVGGKQLHLGFFATEALAARAYDRAAIHKAAVEGGVIVTNLDIEEYAHEIDKLQNMTREELMGMIADEKKAASGGGGGNASGGGGGGGGGGATRRGASGTKAERKASGSDDDSGSGGGGSSSRNARGGGAGASRLGTNATKGRQSGSPSAEDDRDMYGRGSNRSSCSAFNVDRSSPEDERRAKSGTAPAPAAGEDGRGEMNGSEESENDRVVGVAAAPPPPEKKRPAPVVPGSPSHGKQRRTKKPPRQAPCAA